MIKIEQRRPKAGMGWSVPQENGSPELESLVFTVTAYVCDHKWYTARLGVFQNFLSMQASHM